MRPVAITGLGLWMPGYPGTDAWLSGAPDAEESKPKGSALDRVNRRRAGPLGRAITDSATEAMAQAGVDPSQVPTVVGSAIGEVDRMVGLLDQMWRGEEPISPANFTVSVHNAASGLLSISSKNQGYTTSMAADQDTPAMALLEGIGLVCQRRGPALVVCSDEAAPTCLVEGRDQWELLAVACVVEPLDTTTPRLAKLELLASGEASLPALDLGEALGHNPQVGFVDLVDAVLRRTPGSVCLDRGKGRGYLAQVSFDEG